MGNIAIEIKGPTTNQGLQSIADKIARYRLYFSGVICVLFDVLDEGHYDEWFEESGIQTSWSSGSTEAH